MTKHIVTTIIFISIIIFLGSSALGGLIHLTLVDRAYDDLFSGPEIAIGTPMVTSVTGGDVQGNVVSQAFTDGFGHYAYLYQLNSTGGEQNDVFQAFTISPFVGANADTIVGCLTSIPPNPLDGFTLGEQVPYGVTLNLKAGPTISFSFSDLFDCAIDPGESSNTLYVLSNNLPGLIVGNVIDGYAHSGGVVGPVVPEPTTTFLLASFCVAILAYHRRQLRTGQRDL